MLVYPMVVLFVGAAGWSVGSVFAQMHNMTMPSSNPDLSTDHKMTTFSAIGQISSLIITVPGDDFNIADAFNVILTGDWNLSVIKGKITNFGQTSLHPQWTAQNHTCIKYPISNQLRGQLN